MESIRSFFDAAGTFLDHLSEVNVGALLIALALHCANLLLRTKAWHAIISAAFPRDRISKRMVLGAYVAGVGINAFAPARGGDVVKVATVRNRVAHVQRSGADVEPAGGDRVRLRRRHEPADVGVRARDACRPCPTCRTRRPSSGRSSRGTPRAR